MEHRSTINGTTLCWFEWYPELRSSGDTWLLAHATGFHARVWDDMLHHAFAAAGPRHVIALDQRGHGRSGGEPVSDWQVFGEDIAAFVESEDLSGIVGVGHSMGGHAMVQAAARHEARFLRLVLVDPVIARPEAYGGSSAWGDTAEHPTARRKKHFESQEAMIDRFGERIPYSLFTPAAFNDYCQWGLVPAPDGNGYVLGCDPLFEASVYLSSRASGEVFDAVAAVTLPVLILRAKLPPEGDEMDFSNSPTWPELAGAFAHARDVHFSRNTHYLPMELPAEIAAFVLDPQRSPTDIDGLVIRA